MLASVPGTVQAQEALIQAQIPQQATLKRDTATLDVVYAGEPKFEPIPGTDACAYAVNTSFNVVRAGESLLRVLPGRMVRGAGADGRVDAGAAVPAVIYTIPPASPLYRCTYVQRLRA